MSTDPVPSVPFFRSKKFYSAAIGTLVALVPCLMADPNMDRVAKVQMWQNFIYVAAALWGAVIIAQGAADYAERRDAPSTVHPQQPQAPQTQVNVGPGPNVQQQPPAEVVVNAAPPSLVNPGIHNPQPGGSAISTLPYQDKPKGG